MKSTSSHHTMLSIFMSCWADHSSIWQCVYADWWQPGLNPLDQSTWPQCHLSSMVIDVLEAYMTSSVFFSPRLLLFLQHRRYLTFKKVFDERNREEQKKAWEMYTPTWEMDRRVHSGGTWKQIGIGREIDAHQGFLQGGRTCGVHCWDGNVWMERHCGWVMTFFFFFSK